MLKETSELLKQFYDLDDEVFELSQEVMEDIKEKFDEIKEIREFNQYKVLKAMQEANLSDNHFNWTTGYGYNDIGREKVEEIYANVFGAEDALVRPIIVNGTHALSLCVQGLVRPGDEILSITSTPYDTLQGVIGIREEKGSLKEYGVTYDEVDFLENGDIDLEGVKKKINERTKLVMIQRSKGYSWRKSLSIADIKEAIDVVKSVNKDIIVMVDNCYGEFLDTKEPTEVGADVMAGSLIKNPGGGLALTGGYIAGRADLIEMISYRLTSPGIGKECGLTFGTTRTVLQGFFMAPYVTSQAVMGAIFCARAFEKLGYDVLPKYDDLRSDIIQVVKLNNAEEVISFCQGVQAAAPVDAFVKPVPWAMPGYEDEVIMAAGAFVQGSSIELSADAPIREPYNVYFQGGLTFDHSKMGTLKAIQAIKKMKEEYEDLAVVCYINSTAELKTMADICVTSSNAVKIVRSLPNKNIFFIPDGNLGAYVKKQVPEKNIILNDGYCITHKRVTLKDVEKAREEHPNVPIIVHPECVNEVVEATDFAGSTSELIQYTVDNPNKEFVIGTELGVLHEMQLKSPDKTFYPLTDKLICMNMKKVSLEKVYDCLLNETNEVFVDEEVKAMAEKSLDRMLELAK